MTTAATTSESQQVLKLAVGKKMGFNYFTDELRPYKIEITEFRK